ncbi:hypothetical protein C8J56DRAFT_460543 [Mycena floridula]|nr:hypothetical protein C8J56DRAFT_460543 [Mycena floridula]
MSQLILVTGATGFVGSHLITQLFASGYRVRAAARTAKVEQVRAAYAKYGQDFEVVEIADIATDQFPEALKGVHGVIHAASPSPHKADIDEMINGAIEGVLNILRQGEKAGIQRFIVTSSIATVLHPKSSFTDKDWNPVTREDALREGRFMGYRASKALSEKALWEFADSHSNVDVTTFNPPFIYGPFTKEYHLPTPDPSAIGTNMQLYRLLSPTGPFPMSAPYMDIRDLAKAHVLALKSPLSSETSIGRKRLIIGSVYPFEYASALALIKEKRPQLAERLTQTDVPVQDKNKAYSLTVPFDVQRIEDVLGFKREDYTSVEDTLLDTIDSLLAVEKTWIENGHALPK